MLEAFIEVIQKLYARADDEIYLDYLEKCKTFYYEEGHKELVDIDVNNFTDAIYFVYDIAYNDNDLTGVKALADDIFGNLSVEDEDEEEEDVRVTHVKLWAFCRG